MRESFQNIQSTPFMLRTLHCITLHYFYFSNKIILHYLFYIFIILFQIIVIIVIIFKIYFLVIATKFLI